MSDVLGGSDGADVGFLFDLTLKFLTVPLDEQVSAVDAHLVAVGDPAILGDELRVFAGLYAQALVALNGSPAAAVAFLTVAGMGSDILDLGGDLADE